MKFRYIFLVIFAISFMLSCEDLSVKESKGVIHLDGGWMIQNASKIKDGGAVISTPEYKTDAKWIAATVPSTVLNALVESGIYKDIYKDDNLTKIPTAQFSNSWWYRTEFDIKRADDIHLLHFEGINYKANIWLNGHQIAGTDKVINTFRQFKFDITNKLNSGKNILAVEVIPPTKGDFSIGFVDWNPSPPDNNMGIIRKVFIESTKGIALSSPFISSVLNDDLSVAKLAATVELRNYTQAYHNGKVTLEIAGNLLTKVVEIKRGETKIIRFTTDEFPELTIKNPKLWWTHTLGKPILHKADFVYAEDEIFLSEQTAKYGIRSVSSYFTKEGHRGFKLNGEKILIRGGGWVDKLMLEDTEASLRDQLSYVKDMNLNTIRLEGFWGKDQTLYDLCDEMGILIMVGWSCHWEWEDYLGTACSEEYGGILSDEAVDMMSDAWRDQIVWLRNHPSIFSWVGGSDCMPKPELEKRYFETFRQYDSTRVYLASAKEWSSLAGPSGVKMRGPYAYVPPVYWYSDTQYGGAFGFNTETGPGAQVPPLESIKKMLSPNHLSLTDSLWDYHCGRHEFNNLTRFTKALEARYGKATSLEDYTTKAQVLNYELMRPMFEAFSARRDRATGVIQWMLNSAWPEMYWQLYDYYLMPNGAYFGAKKASQSYHAIYDYDEHAIYVVNDKLEDLDNCILKVRAYDTKSILQYDKEIPIKIPANSGNKILDLPPMSWAKSMYFLDMRIVKNSGEEIDNNFYWMSTKKDVLDYKAVVPGWNYHTPSKEYANFKALNNLPKVVLQSSIEVSEKTTNWQKYKVTIANDSKFIAFFVHPEIIEKSTGNAVLPVMWSDNYISLVPGETRVLTAKIKNDKSQQKDIELKVTFYNQQKK